MFAARRYFSSLILVEGMDIDFLHKCALEDCTDQHQFYSTPEVTKVGATSVVFDHSSVVSPPPIADSIHPRNSWVSMPKCHCSGLTQILSNKCGFKNQINACAL